MTDKRTREVLTWLDPHRWPSWEFVMYINKVTVEESLELLEILGPENWKFVANGIEAYTKKKIVPTFGLHSVKYNLVNPEDYAVATFEEAAKLNNRE